MTVPAPDSSADTTDCHVVAVFDHDSERSPLAQALLNAQAGSNVTFLLRTPDELCSEVSIYQAPDTRPVVMPDRCLLILTSGFRSPHPTDADSRFLAAEIAATTRSIAMCTQAPVLNRPTDRSIAGWLPVSRVQAVRRARLTGGGDTLVRAEHFSTEVQDDSGLELEVHDYATSRSRYGFPPVATAAGPFRSRPAVPTAHEVRVTLLGGEILGRQAIPDSTVSASRELAEYFQLDLATFWWLVAEGTDNSATNTLSRISPNVMDAVSASSMVEVATGLVRWAASKSQIPRTP